MSVGGTRKRGCFPCAAGGAGRSLTVAASARRLTFHFSLFTFQCLLLISSAAAQQPGADADLSVPENVFFPADRASLQRLSTAEQLIADERWDEAVRFLDAILQAPEDFFFQRSKGSRTFRSLRTEAQRLLGQLPAKGRDSYELQFGAQARKLLADAIQAGDASALAEVSRRFFHTRAGYEATELLGTYQMEHGQPLAAALCFRRLREAPAAAATLEPLVSVKLAICCLRAGLAPEATELLNVLRKRDPELTVKLAGKEERLFVPGHAEPVWLAKWASAGDVQLLSAGWMMSGGSPDRNAVTVGGAPLLNHRWAVSAINDPRLEKLAEQVRQSYVDQAIAALPAYQPLAVGDLIITRSVAGLVAIDFRTGKRIWRGPTDEAVKSVLDTQSIDRATADASLLATWLDQRLLGDATYGALASDGRLVFCVEDVGSGLGSDRMMTIIPANGRMRVQTPWGRSSNRLAAYEIASQGKLVWELPGDERSDLAGAFFLGPPLPLAGRLYTLVEIKGEIRLLALDSKTGRVQWAQQLAVLEQTALDSGLRHVSGLSPSYADGVLVCPTAAGAVVAVDLTTRSLLWGYQYPSATPLGRMPFRGFAPTNTVSAAGGNDHWFDATVALADGRVLLTPRDTPEEGEMQQSELHCLDLADGKSLWRKRREDGMFIGCVSKGKVLVVGRSSLRAYNLADGAPAWKAGSVALPAGALPSGRGFLSEGRYYLPLSTAEVVAVDLNNGRLTTSARSRSRDVVGNLLCYRGAVLSQSPTQIECFYQLNELEREVAGRLKKNADDPQALALEGELLLNAGKLDDAIGRLRRSLSRRAQPRTRQLLVEALLDALSQDFAAHRSDVAELQRLVETPSERVQFLRVLALGRQTMGEVAAAFDTYMQIVDVGRSRQELDEIGRELHCRRERWVAARLSALRQTALPADLAKMDREIGERLKQADRAGPDSLREFLAWFGEHPLGDAARELLLASLDTRVAGDSGTLLERELLLRHLERSAEPARQRAAVARLAQLFLDAGREEDAAGYFSRLAGPLADVVCWREKTGRELVAELPADSEVRQQLAGHDPWPIGRVKRETLRAQPAPSYKSMPIELRGPKGPYYTRSMLELDQQQQSLVGRDGLGRERWRISLADRTGDRNTHGVNPAISHARVNGHLLLVSLGVELVALDTIGTPGRQGPHVLWRHDLADTLPQPLAVHGQLVNMPWGPPRFVASDNAHRPVGTTGPLLESLACFQRQRSLVGVDPTTGEMLWTRSGIQPGSEVIGDDELLFVTAPGSQQALVLRTLDGSEVGRRTMPAAGNILAVFGRRVAVWEPAGKSPRVLKLRDIWDERDVWQYTFDAGAKAWPVDDEAVGVLDHQGRFVMVSLADGKRTIDSHLEPDPSLTEIYIFRTSTHDLLVTNRPVLNRNNESVQPVPGGFGNLGNPPINGFVHGFDRRTGKHVYSTRVENLGLLLNQPADLPMLTFASQVQRASRLGQVSRAVIKCVDKRTGRIIVDEQSSGPILSVEQSGDPHQHQVTVKTTRASFRLTFTDEPWPAEGEKPATAGLPSRIGRELLRGMQKLLEGQVPGK